MKFYGQFNPPVDKVLYERYFMYFMDKKNLTSIECGAFDGLTENCTKFFEENFNWNTINIEALPHIFEKLKLNRPSSININIALSDTKGKKTIRVYDIATYGINNTNASLCHLPKHQKLLEKMSNNKYKDFEIYTTTYSSLIKELKINKLNLFSLNVEGHEYEVIDGMKDSEIFPEVFVIAHGWRTPEDVVNKLKVLPVSYKLDFISHFNSYFVLQEKKAFVLTHLGLGDHITAIGMVRYLRTIYDKIIIVCTNKNKENVRLFYSDDDNFEILGVNSGMNISPNLGFNMSEFKKITKYCSTYLCGQHNLSKKWKCTGKLPLDFYEQLGMNTSIFWEYFHIPIHEESIKLYQEMKNIPYVFIHNIASFGKVFDIHLVETKLGLDKHKILFINPNVNCYVHGDNFYHQANKYIGHKLIYYTEVIKNAEYNILSDSSFMCMAINLDIKKNNNYYFTRTDGNYDHLYSTKYKFRNLNRRIFHNFKSL